MFGNKNNRVDLITIFRVSNLNKIEKYKFSNKY